MIEIRNISKRYEDTVVLEDVSLAIPRCGVTSIIGPNGAGKSTLLSIMSRLLPMDAGQVTVDGLDVSTAGEQLARRLAILRQENHVTARLTVRDLVAFGRYPHSKGRPTTEDLWHVEQALDRLQLQNLSHRFLDELSGGQRQRAFMAMVLCQDTEYVLLDEPLANLDMSHAATMMRLLRRAADELGRTVVLVVHDINFASCHSDHIIAMRDGGVALQGAPPEVMQPHALKQVYGIDIHVEEIDGNHIAVYYA